jgi:hypothetical protein
MKHIKTFDGFLNEGKEFGAQVETKGDNKPSISAYQKQVNGVDNVDFKIETSFYHNGTIQKSKEKKFALDFADRLSTEFLNAIPKFSAPGNGSGKLNTQPRVTVIQKVVNGSDTIIVDIDNNIGYSGNISNMKKCLEALQNSFAVIFDDAVAEYTD